MKQLFFCSTFVAIVCATFDLNLLHFYLLNSFIFLCIIEFNVLTLNCKTKHWKT